MAGRADCGWTVAAPLRTQRAHRRRRSRAAAARI